MANSPSTKKIPANPPNESSGTCLSSPAGGDEEEGHDHERIRLEVREHERERERIYADHWR